MENKALGTLLDGIGSSEHLDSSGERISIKGLDISSLVQSGVFNFEHKSDTPAQIVGKILEAKKIYSEADCENERHLYYWNKVQVPYLYVMGELFDAVGHEGAQQIAAILKYDSAARKAGRKGDNVINFSVEGNKLDSQGQDIKRSIARKITVTVFACNKQAIAEELTPQKNTGNPKKDLIQSIAKSEDFGAEILEKGYGGSAIKSPTGLWTMNTDSESAPAAPAPKAMAPQKQAPKTAAPAPAKPQAPVSNIQGQGSVLGQTKSGKDVFSHSQPRNYVNFTSQDHSDAMNHHYNLSLNTQNYKEKNHHIGMAKLHGAFRDRKEAVEKRSVVKKSVDVAPSMKVNGNALAREKVEDMYRTFEKKEQLEALIKRKYPQMNRSEVVALAKMTVYKKEKDLEKILSSLKV